MSADPPIPPARDPDWANPKLGQDRFPNLPPARQLLYGHQIGVGSVAVARHASHFKVANKRKGVSMEVNRSGQAQAWAQSEPEAWSERPEFPLYVALKAQVCRQAAVSSPSGPAQFTARRVLNLLAGPSLPGRDQRLFTDLYAVSSHLIRARLDTLNSSTVLQKAGRGLRNSTTYKWVEPIPADAVQSLDRLQRLVEGNIQFALDVYRIADGFNDQPFRPRDFVRLLRDHHDRFARRSRASLFARTSPFTEFLLRRLDGLVQKGFLEALPNGDLRLSAKGEDVAHWFELFAYSAEYGHVPAHVTPTR